MMTEYGNIDDILLSLVKFKADAQKYFSLFDKHIPRFEADGKGKNILLLGLSNEAAMLKMCALNPKSKYYVADQEILSQTLPLLDKNLDFEFLDSNLSLYDMIKGSDMKFDCIIMNPPYDKNLHLKILAEAISHLKDNDSVCVNLSPNRWLKDNLALYKKSSDYKKFENSISKHLVDVEEIPAAEANNMFSAGIMTDLGIFVAKKEIGTFDYHIKNIIVQKILNTQCKKISDVVENKKINGWRWQISELQPLNAQGGAKYSYGWYRHFCIFNHLRSTIFYNGKRDGKHWTYYTSGVSHDKTGTKPFQWSIPFKSELEAINFEESVKTTFYKYYVLQIKIDQHTPFQFLPFMSDYTKPWTDERFYKFFNITKEEQKIIEDTMAKYK